MNDCDLKILCGGTLMYHAGFASSHYNSGGSGWVWQQVNGHWIQVLDNNLIVSFPPPTSPWYCMIRCGVTYHGYTHWFAKEVIVTGR